MTINLQGVERYQSHQQSVQPESTQASQTAASAEAAGAGGIDQDAVSLSGAATVMEWIAHQTTDLSGTQATAPANLGRLSDHLLRYNLVSLPEAGRLMSLANPEAEPADDEAINGRIRSLAGQSETWQEKQQWQKLDRLVSTLTAAQSTPPH